MKVLILNGSPHPNGNTAIALQEMVKVFPQGNIDVELINVGNKAIPLDAMAAEKKANASLMTR